MVSDLERVIRFAAVAEELSFTRAAEKLRIDQPWLSRQIRQLENELGVDLFVRGRRQIELTPEGRAFLAHAQTFAEAAREVRSAARQITQKTTAVIRLGAPTYSYSIGVRSELIRRFTDRSRAQVVPTHGLTDALIAQLQSGEIDVALLSSPFRPSGLDHVLVHRNSIGLLILSDDPLAARPRVSLDELSGRRIAVTPREENPARYDNMYGWIEKVGAIPVTVGAGRPFMIEAALEQRLIVVAFNFTGNVSGDSVGLIYKEIEGPRPEVDTYFAKASSNRNKEVARWFSIASSLAADLRDEQPPAVKG